MLTGVERVEPSLAHKPARKPAQPPCHTPPLLAKKGLPACFVQEYNEHVHVLLTVGTPEAYTLLSGSLPPRVVLQYVPLENPVSVRLFLRHWRPQVGIFMVSAVLWPACVGTRAGPESMGQRPWRRGAPCMPAGEGRAREARAGGMHARALEMQLVQQQPRIHAAAVRRRRPPGLLWWSSQRPRA